MVRMILPGHLGAGYLAAHYIRADERIALVAALFPDVVDKTGRYILRITPNARVPAHSIVLGIFTTLLVWLFIRRRPAVWGWAAGYATHLIGDLATDLLNVNGGSWYLLWPLVSPTPGRYKTLLGSVFAYSGWACALEAAICVWAGMVLVRTLHLRRLARRPTQSDPYV